MRKYLKPVSKLFYGVIGMMMIVSIVEGATALAESTVTTYPGTMCQPFGGSSVNDIRYTSSGAYNQSTTQSLTVYCPIPYTLSGGKLSSVIIDVKDQSDEATISCTAYVRGLNGDLVHSESGNSEEFFGGNSDVFLMNMNYDGSGGVYNVRCRLPQRIGGVGAFTVVSYSAWENNNN